MLMYSYSTNQKDSFPLLGAYCCYAGGATPMKKGGTANAALWSSVQQDQPSGVSLVFFRWRRFISPCKAETTNCPVLSPGSLSSSTAWAISCGTLAAIVCDFAFTALVAISVYSLCGVQQYGRRKISVQHLTCSTPFTRLVLNTYVLNGTKTAKPAGATNTSGPLTTSDRSRIEVAMQNHITPQTGRDSLTPNKFIWRFMAIDRINREAKPYRLSVEAGTEQEARRVLAPHFILSLAARLPVQAVRHV